MSLKTVVYSLFLVLLVNFSKVQSVGPLPQIDNNQESVSNIHIQEQHEQEQVTLFKQDIFRIIKSLDEQRKYDDEIRKQELSEQVGVARLQLLKEQAEFHKLELKIREQIEHILQTPDNQKLLNKDYSQQIKALNKSLAEFKKFIRDIVERRIEEQRVKELRSIHSIRLTSNARWEYEHKLSAIEQPPKDVNTKNQRKQEQISLTNIQLSLEGYLKRLQDWHDKNEPLNNEHKKISQSINYNVQAFTTLTGKMDQRRIQERLEEAQEVTKIKEILDAHRELELIYRKREQPTTNQQLTAVRQNEKLIEDGLDAAIRKRIYNMEKRLAQNYPLDSDYALQRALLNQDWLKIQTHVASVQQRRIKELQLTPLEQQQLGQISQNIQPNKKQKTSNG